MSLYELADWYGSEMKRYGMSQYNERMNVSDPTPKLFEDETYQKLTTEQKDQLLEYGKNMKTFGMGMYAERGYCAAYYDRCGGQPPRNPFYSERANEAGEPGKN